MKKVVRIEDKLHKQIPERVRGFKVTKTEFVERAIEDKIKEVREINLRSKD